MVTGNLRFSEQLQGAELAEDTVQFSVLLRKNNKPAYKEVAVPRESDIARNLQMQEEVDRLEKERVKQLTLAINDIQEEEDFNESLAAVSSLLSIRNVPPAFQIFQIVLVPKSSSCFLYFRCSARRW